MMTQDIQATRGGVMQFSLIALCAAIALLAGCGDKKEKAASQTAAKVNKAEVTVHQINFVLQQQREARHTDHSRKAWKFSMKFGHN